MPVKRWCRRCNMGHEGPCPKKDEKRFRRPWADAKGRRPEDTARKKYKGKILARANKHCEMCGCLADWLIIDHTIPLAEDGEDVYENLQAVCRGCHKIKTKQEQKRGRERAKQ